MVEENFPIQRNTPLDAQPVALPVGFQFSQSSLQDYTDCRRRFQLRYLQQLAWPAVQSEPALEHERFMERGSRFHRLARQLLSGLPSGQLEPLVQDPDLLDWWQAFLDFTRQQNFFAAGALYPEHGLSASLGEYRLVAQYDLIHRTESGRFVIYDWKTSTRRAPRKWLADRLQTRLYPYLLVRAGASMNGGAALEPGSVEMVYWFSAFPGQPERFPYSPAQFERDGAFLASLLGEIASLPADQFVLTPYAERCAFCVYRSLCNRGERAGALEDELEALESEPPGELRIDFDQIAEIEF